MTGTPRWRVEIDVMRTVYHELRQLDQTEQDRALKWVLDRLAVERAAHHTAIKEDQNKDAAP